MLESTVVEGFVSGGECLVFVWCGACGMVVVCVSFAATNVWQNVCRASRVCGAKGNAPKQDRTTDLPLTKRVLYH